MQVAGVRVHEIRTAEIYTLTDDMNEYLKDSPERDGLCVSADEPNWDQIAKIAWYWRSDLWQVATIEDAIDSLETGRYSYFLSEKSQTDILAIMESAYPGQLRKVTENDRLVILEPQKPDSSAHISK